MSKNVRLIVKISKDAADVKEAILNEIDRLIKEGEGSSTDEKMHTTELRRDYDYTTYEVVCVIEESRDEETKRRSSRLQRSIRMRSSIISPHQMLAA